MFLWLNDLEGVQRIRCSSLFLTSIPKKTKFLLQLRKVAPRLDSSSLLTKKEPHCCVVIMLVAYPMQQNLHIVLVSMHFHKPPPPLSVLPSAVWPQHLSASAAAPRRSLSGRPYPVSATGDSFSLRSSPHLMTVYTRKLS